MGYTEPIKNNVCEALIKACLPKGLNLASLSVLAAGCEGGHLQAWQKNVDLHQQPFSPSTRNGKLPVSPCGLQVAAALGSCCSVCRCVPPSLLLLAALWAREPFRNPIHARGVWWWARFPHSFSAWWSDFVLLFSMVLQTISPYCFWSTDLLAHWFFRLSFLLRNVVPISAVIDELALLLSCIQFIVVIHIVTVNAFSYCGSHFSTHTFLVLWLQPLVHTSPPLPQSTLGMCASLAQMTWFLRTAKNLPVKLLNHLHVAEQSIWHVIL